jgi:hypothetical protein
MNPARTELSWYVEHAHSKREMIQRTAGTMRRLALPWVFWRLVGFESTIRIRALAVWLGLFAAGLHLLVSIPAGFGFWLGASSRYYGSLGSLYQSAGIKGLLVPVINALGYPFVDIGVSYRTGELFVLSGYFNSGSMRETILISVPFIGMTLLWLIIMLVVPTTRRRAKIRSAHVFRATLISMLTIFIAFEMVRLAHGIDMFTSKSGFVSGGSDRLLMETIIPIMMIWLLVFWASAIRVGWKIRPSWSLVFMGSIASLLGGFVIYYVTAVYFDWI